MGVQMLKLHWKAARWPLLPFLALAFGLPLVTSRLAWAVGGSDWLSPAEILDLSAEYAVAFPALAAFVGSLIALTAWNWDHQVGHVYPLSLPISRARYAALKFAVGGGLLVVPTVLVLLGALVASALVELPVGLNIYPLDLTVRFFLGSLLAYGLFFALASGRMRTAVVVLGSFSALIVFGGGLFEFAESVVPAIGTWEVNQLLGEALVGRWGIFGIYSGNWALIDV